MGSGDRPWARDILPDSVGRPSSTLEEDRRLPNYYYNIATAYGSARRSAGDKADVKVKVGAEGGGHNGKDANHLYTADFPDPDLILRTSGEERISNFLLWQLAYAELYFTDVYWPGFRRIDFLRAIRSYQMRRRRFGT